LPWPVLLLDSVETLDKLHVGTAPLLAWIAETREGIVNGTGVGDLLDGFAAVAIEARTDSLVSLRVRVFFNNSGSIIEDPATGSAALA